MSRVRIALRPTQDTNHTEVTVTLPLRRPLAAWELMDLCELLKARSQLPVRVALPAEGPSEWLDEWCSVLADAVVARIEVQFTASRVRRRHEKKGRQGQLGFVEPRDVLRRP
jgi:hypothetical protein